MDTKTTTTTKTARRIVSSERWHAAIPRWLLARRRVHARTWLAMFHTLGDFMKEHGRPANLTFTDAATVERSGILDDPTIELRQRGTLDAIPWNA